MVFANPVGNVAQLGKIEGFSVADFGAGSGAYSLALAEKVGLSGKVYAVEVQKELLSNIKNTALSQNLVNVEVLWGDIEVLEGTKIASDTLDLVVVANVLFIAEDKKGLVAEVQRVLKPKGRVLVVDWKDSYGGMGPTHDMVIRADEAKHYFEDAGFVFETMIETGTQHYGFIMSNQSN
jgi:ubiquinone/menaquinone biosynthesis C-methylase UbiE